MRNDYESINFELRRALRLYVRGLTTRAAVDRLTVEAREALIRETEHGPHIGRSEGVSAGL